MTRRSYHPGIQVRHRRGCASARGLRCSCSPTYLAEVWSSKDAKKIRRAFATLGDAKAWRADAQVQLRKGLLRASTPVTLQEAADAWLAGARSGAIRNRSGDPYKPSTLRGYSLADLEASMQTPESQDAQQRLLEDESTFIDFARSSVFMTEEHVIVDRSR